MRKFKSCRILPSTPTLLKSLHSSSYPVYSLALHSHPSPTYSHIHSAQLFDLEKCWFMSASSQGTNKTFRIVLNYSFLLINQPYKSPLIKAICVSVSVYMRCLRLHVYKRDALTFGSNNDTVELRNTKESRHSASTTFMSNNTVNLKIRFNSNWDLQRL